MISADPFQQVRALLPIHLQQQLGSLHPADGAGCSQMRERLEQIYSALVASLPDWVTSIPAEQSVRRIADATVLFADISGSTSLTLRLHQHRDGIEQLVQLVNQRFQIMVDVVHHWAGSVLSFGGDGLLACFSAEGHTEHALAAASEIQARFQELPALHLVGSARPFPIGVKVGVARGPVDLTAAGTGQRRVVLALGAALSAVDRLGASASAGEIRVASSLANGLNVSAVGSHDRVLTHLPHQPARPRVPDRSAPAVLSAEALLGEIARLAPFVPAEVARELAGTAQPVPGVGEKRDTISLFAYFDGLHALAEYLRQVEPDYLEGVLHEILGWSIEQIEHAGGILARIDPYAQGSKLLALFGAPHAREHIAEQAIRTALQLCERLGSINATITQRLESICTGAAIPRVRVCAGLEQGETLAALVGSASRYEYTVMGDAVNTAARLMSLADLDRSEVLIGPRLYATTRAALEQVAARTAFLRGRGEALIYSVARIRERGWRPISAAPLIGRDQELRRLGSALEAIKQGRPAVAIVQGEAGIGKTRLRQAFLAQVRHHADCLVVNAPGRASPFYATWRDVVRQLCGLSVESGDDKQILEAALQQRNLASDLLVRAALSYLAGILSDAPPILGTTSSARNQILTQQMLRFLTACAATRPLALFFEDLHALDPESLALLARLIELGWSAPILLCLTLRPDGERADESVTPQDICRSARARFAETAIPLNLQPLSDQHGHALLNVLLPGLAPRTSGELLEHAHGNPLFLELLVAQVVQRDALRRDVTGRYYELDQPLHELGIAATLHEVVLAQLDSLSVPARELAKAAAVIGSAARTIDEHMLVTLAGEDAAVEPYLAELLDAQIIEPAPAGAPLYVFRHPLYQTAAMKLLQAHERRAFHRRAARVLERQYGQLEEHTEALAYHCYEAQEWQPALGFALGAGQRAARAYLHTKASRWLLKALRLALRLGAASELNQARIELGELFSLAGYWTAAQFQLQAARAKLEELPAEVRDPLLMARCCRLLALVGERTATYEADHQQVDLLYQEGLALARQVEPASAEVGQITILRAEALWRRGRLDEAEELCQQALLKHVGLPEQAGERAALTQRLAMIAGQRGQYRRAIKGLQASLEIARPLGDPYLVAQILNNLGLHSINLGEPDSAISFLSESLQIKQQIGDTVGSVRSMENLGRVLLSKEDFAGAEAAYQECRALCERLKLHQSLANVTDNLGHLYYLQGRLDEAQTMFDAAMALYTSLSDPDGIADCAYRLGDVALARGQAASARAYGEAALAQAESIASDVYRACALRVIGEAQTVAGDLPGAAETLARAQTIQERVDDAYDRALLWRAQGLLLMAQGQHAAAKQMLIAALELARSKRNVHLEALVQRGAQPIASL